MRLRCLVVAGLVVSVLARSPARAGAAFAPVPGTAGANPGAGPPASPSGNFAIGFLGLNLMVAGSLVELYAGWQESGQAALVGLGLIGVGVVIMLINGADTRAGHPFGSGGGWGCCSSPAFR